ncbi:unnamed protein product [Ranitomeya imitator]|uniref:Uncharacterized protein n=1 Tax=Ranitomeya imitator TaxID=111125 RepID=A0ABN9KPZ5_9NEOB|nr:unnamed protein product [Ranitomeya imitator]
MLRISEITDVYASTMRHITQVWNGGPKKVNKPQIQENLAIVYSMENPATYTIYEPVIRMKGCLKTTPSQRPFSTKEVTSKSLDSQSLKMIFPCTEKNIQSVLHEIGGIGSIVFLFARACTGVVQSVYLQTSESPSAARFRWFLSRDRRIVEISNFEKTQSLGLQIVLSLVKYNQQRIQESGNCDIYPMIHKVLMQPKCIVGFHILKARARDLGLNYQELTKEALIDLLVGASPATSSHMSEGRALETRTLTPKSQWVVWYDEKVAALGPGVSQEYKEEAARRAQRRQEAMELERGSNAMWNVNPTIREPVRITRTEFKPFDEASGDVEGSFKDFEQQCAVMEVPHSG